MLFNSLVLPVALVGALSLRGKAWRAWVLVASYVCYGYWDPRFLVLSPARQSWTTSLLLA